LVFTTEEYTSMTCGGHNCGHLNRKLGSKDVFKCTAAECNANINRLFWTEEEEQEGDEFFLKRCGVLFGDHQMECSYVSGRDESAGRNITLLPIRKPKPLQEVPLQRRNV
jgi:hypothetical protein